MLSRYDKQNFSEGEIIEKIDDFEDAVKGRFLNAPTTRLLLGIGVAGLCVVPCGLPAAIAIASPILVNAIKNTIRNGAHAEYVERTGLFYHLLSSRELAQLSRYTGPEWISEQITRAYCDGQRLTPAAKRFVIQVEGELTPTTIEAATKHLQLTQAEREGWAPMPPDPDAPVRITTQLGEPSAHIEVPSLDMGTATPQTFDWNRLNTEYDNFPHLFLLGKTGSGKSYLSDRLGRFLNGHSILISPKKMPQDFQGYQAIGLPYDYAVIYRALVGLEKLMRQREAEMQKTKNANFTPINVVLDEVPVFVAGCKEQGNDPIKPLKSLIRAGRTSRIRLILLAQGAEVKTLGIEGEGGLRDSLTYVYLKGFAEKHAADLKLDISGIDRPCVIDGTIADTAFLQQYSTVEPRGLKLGAPAPQQPPIQPTREDLEQMHSQSSAPYEVEESVDEGASLLPGIREAFPNWNPQSLEVAATIVAWLSDRAEQSFTPAVIRQSIRRLKDDPTLPTDRVKKLLDLLASAQFLVGVEGKYTIAPTAKPSADYDF